MCVVVGDVAIDWDQADPESGLTLFGSILFSIEEKDIVDALQSLRPSI